jgi:lipopolysaccharide heptosyltransferase I
VTDRPRNILLIRPSALGDVARSVPALVSVRGAFPDARIDWLVEQGFEDVIAAHPALSSTVSFPKRAIKAAMRRLNPGPLLAFRKQLKAARYDMVFDLQGLARSATMAYATGAPCRIGLAQARELGWLAYTLRVKADIDMHAVDRMLAVVAGAGITPVADMRLYTPPGAMKWLADQPWSGDSFVLLAPTSRWPAKQWPAERFAQLAAALRSAGLAVVVVGGKSERSQCGPLLELAAGDAGVIDLIGATSVGQLMAVIGASRVVVANDSAALHIAVGLDRPTVALYGPTRVHRVGPYGREAEVIQHLRDADTLDHKAIASVVMMQRIGVQEVIDATFRRVAAARRQD